MTTLLEIKAAIRRLSKSDVDDLIAWLRNLRASQAEETQVQDWLRLAIGAAKPSFSTDKIMTATRGEE